MHEESVYHHQHYTLCLISTIVFVGFWAETSLHNGIVDQVVSVGSFAGNFTDDPDTANVIDNVLLLVEDKRYDLVCMYMPAYII